MSNRENIFSVVKLRHRLKTWLCFKMAVTSITFSVSNRFFTKKGEIPPCKLSIQERENVVKSDGACLSDCCLLLET